MKRLISKVLGKVAAAADLPPAWSGYRYLRTEGLVAHAYRQVERGSAASVVPVFPSDTEAPPLPCNVTDARALPTSRGRWGRSFADIPSRKRSGASLVTIQDCLVLATKGEWGLEHFTFLSDAGDRLLVSGGRFLPGHRALIKSAGVPQEVGRVAWMWESWYHNYFHWLIRHIPKLTVFRERHLDQDLVLPPHFTARSFMVESAGAAGVALEQIPPMAGSVLRAKQLTFLDCPDMTSSLIRDIRRHFVNAPEGKQSRKLYVSRRLADRRHLVNEPEVWKELERLGYEEVCLEHLGFAEQVVLFAEARVIVGLHGAGLSNIVFSAPGAHVVEISDLSFPNPEYYDLAVASGHHYWLIFGTHVGEKRPGYHHVGVDLEDLSRVAKQVENALDRCS